MKITENSETFLLQLLIALVVICILFWGNISNFLMTSGVAVQAISTIALLVITGWYANLTRRQLTFHEEKDKKDFSLSLILRFLESDYIEGFQHIQQLRTDSNKIDNVFSFLEFMGTAYFFEKVNRDIIYDFFKLDILRIYPKARELIRIVREKTGEKESFERFEFMAQDFQKRRELEDMPPLRKE